MILVSLRDTKAETYSAPRACSNKAVALREFAALVNDRQPTVIASHPADFDLFEVGTWFDDYSANVLHSVPIHLANGVDLKVKE